MDESTLSAIEKRVAELPPDVQAAVLDNNLPVRIQAIGKEHQLHIDQLELLEEEALLVMLGFTESEQFTEKIRGALHLEEAGAISLSQDINTQIIGPIRDSMKAFAASRKGSDTPKIAEPLPPTPPSTPPFYTNDPYREPVE